MTIDRFNVRVYGLLVQRGSVLLSHEMISGKPYLKFPGGGLEFGEGPESAVVREFIEEASLQIAVVRVLHITGDFVQSAFRTTDQVVGIYYEVEALGDAHFPATAPSIESVISTGQQLYWAPLNRLCQDNLSFEIDRVALRAYRKRYVSDR